MLTFAECPPPQCSPPLASHPCVLLRWCLSLHPLCHPLGLAPHGGLAAPRLPHSAPERGATSCCCCSMSPECTHSHSGAAAPQVGNGLGASGGWEAPPLLFGEQSIDPKGWQDPCPTAVGSSMGRAGRGVLGPPGPTGPIIFVFKEKDNPPPNAPSKQNLLLMNPH